MKDQTYLEPYGIWEVSTEGDCEGRSIRHLGTHEGFIDEIAFALADKTYYSLHFKIAKRRPPCPTRDTVSVQLDIGSGTWDMTGEQRAAAFRQMLGTRAGKVVVTPCQYFASVKLSLGLTDTERKELERERVAVGARAKLSKEELKALGLNAEE